MSAHKCLLVLPMALGLMASQALPAAEGAKLYGFYCAQCHGPKGEGDGPNVTKDFAAEPRNFTATAEMEKLSDADIRNVVMDGGPSVSKSNLMPPWGKTLSRADVDALVAYLRKLCACRAKVK